MTKNRLLSRYVLVDISVTMYGVLAGWLSEEVDIAVVFEEMVC